MNRRSFLLGSVALPLTPLLPAAEVAAEVAVESAEVPWPLGVYLGRWVSSSIDPYTGGITWVDQ